MILGGGAMHPPGVLQVSKSPVLLGLRNGKWYKMASIEVVLYTFRGVFFI